MVDGRSQPPGDPANASTVRRVFDAFARRDVEGALELASGRLLSWSEDGSLRVWSAHGTPLAALAGHTGGVYGALALADGRLLSWSGHPYIGHAGIRQYAHDVERVWQQLDLQPIEFDDVGDAIVVLGEVRARGAAGALREPTVWTWKFRDGLVIDCRVDSDLPAARKALGEAKTVEDLIRGFVAAFNRREAEAMIAFADPRIVAYPAKVSRTSRSYAGHQGLRHWVQDVVANDRGQRIAAREVRKLEAQRWAVLGELTIDAVPLSPFASLFAVAHGLITEAHEYLSEESLLRELDYLP